MKREDLVALRYRLSRRALLRAGAGLAGAGAMGALAGARTDARAAPAPGAAAERPNVVLIIADDQGWTDFGFMGHPDVKTPHLDALASRGVVFERGYVAAPLCRPSLASIVTGLYPHQHRICCNDPAGKGPRDQADYPYMKDLATVPRLLRPLGYRSLQTGKWWEHHYEAGGFTDGMTVKGRHGEAGLAIGRQTMGPICTFVDDCAAKKEPFFLWYAPMMPHTPHNPPERSLAKYAEGRPAADARYYAMCEWFDETCGQLLGHLEKRGLRQRTLVLFIADNGWTQGHLGEKAGRARGKRTPYEGGVRTPVILDWPGRTKAARRPDLASAVDLAPPILAACGARPTPQMQGLSLLDAAAGGKALPRQAVFGEAFVHTAKDMERPGANLLSRWVRQGDWKLIVPAAGEEAAGAAHGQAAKAELFNLAEDPFETKDLAAARPDQAAALRQTLDAWWDGR